MREGWEVGSEKRKVESEKWKVKRKKRKENREKRKVKREMCIAHRSHGGGEKSLPRF
jgi:hypothetical protein